MSRARAITQAFGIAVVIVLAFFYFVVIEGRADRILLKAINKNIPFILKWGGRSFLDFSKVEIIKDNRYFYAPKLRINLRPLCLEFQEGYSSQGKKLIIKDISGRASMKFVWPYKLYPHGQVSMQGRVLESPVWVKGKIDLEKKCFAISSRFDRIDLEILTAAINPEKFGGSGKWKGVFNFTYEEDFRGEGEFRLISQGEIKTVFLKNLIRKMPEGEGKKKLLEGLGEDEYFPLSRGEMNFSIKGDDVKVKLILEGEKGLFDFTVNLPTTLLQRFLKGELIGGKKL